MDMRTKMKLAMLYLKYRKYIWPAVGVAALLALAAVYFLWLR
jgi:hypothetical protein